MEEAIVAYLKNLSSLTALTANRIYWMQRPQGETALPTVVMQLISEGRELRNDGPDGLVEAAIQIDAYGSNLNQALDVSRVLVDELEGASFTQSGVTFQAVLVDTRRHALAETPMPPELKRVAMQMTFWHRMN